MLLSSHSVPVLFFRPRAKDAVVSYTSDRLTRRHGVEFRWHLQLAHIIKVRSVRWSMHFLNVYVCVQCASLDILRRTSEDRVEEPPCTAGECVGDGMGGIVKMLCFRCSVLHIYHQTSCNLKYHIS